MKKQEVKMKDVIICGCDPQTRYECGGMIMFECPYASTVCEAYMTLCESRHEIPQAIDGGIFPNEITDPMNMLGLYKTAKTRLDPMKKDGMKVLNLYVTGMSTALVTVVNYCLKNNVTLVTWHYDKKSGKYVDFPISD